MLERPMARERARRATKRTAPRAGGHALPHHERALVITAHPDDAEFGAGGTIGRLVRQGTQVAYVVATNGNKGSGDRSMTPERLAAIRETEQRNAARALGVEDVTFLGYEDGELEDTRAFRLDVTRQIRRWRPELIITQNPHRTTNLYGSHRDHRITAGVVLDCVYPLARDHMAFPELLPDYEPHRVREVLLMQWDDPQLVVDVTETIDLKLKALACHVSQLGDFARVEARVRERGAELGKPKRYAYAETFDRILLPR
jgi:LmbE family N-acetylglucosaminyl deacetylase